MHASCATADGDSCPRSSEVRDYLCGTLGDEQSAQVEQHVAACPACSILVDTVTETSDPTLRVLASLPICDDDEPELQDVVAELLDWQGDHLPEGVDLYRLAEPLLGPLPETLGKYELLECIGRGAWGAVYRARHTKLDQIVAVKVLDTRRWPALQTVERFTEEWRAIGKLCHPNVVRATDAGEDRGLPYLAMEYVDGLDAAKLLRARGRLPTAEACEIVRQAAVALQFAHEQSLVHRDVKPSNLLVAADGTVKLADLGLAGTGTAANFVRSSVGRSGAGEGGSTQPIAPPACAPQSLATSATNRSGPHRLPASVTSPCGPRHPPLGTIEYMAPEQWSNFDGVDARADVYSLGRTLYKLLCGELPGHTLNASSTTSVRLRQLRPDVRPKLARLVEQMTAHAPEQRLASAGEAADRLRSFAAGANLPGLIEGQLAGEPASTTAPGRRPIVTRRAFVGASAAAAAGLLALPRLLGDRWPQLGRSAWRPLRFDAAEVWMTAGDRAAAEARPIDARQLRLASQELTLVTLGRPVEGPFAWSVALQQPDWQGGAGMFFRGHAVADGARAYRFHTLELRPPGHATQRLLWARWHVVFDAGGPHIEREPLADAQVEVVGRGPQELAVELGRGGFPAVLWNGRPLAASQWEMSVAARRMARMPGAEAAGYFLGRLGVFSSQAPTLFADPQFAYGAADAPSTFSKIRNSG